MSVRSGAAVSMPGMMDTVLNLGLTDRNGPRHGGRPRKTHALPTIPYRQFIQMFANVVMELDMTPF